MSTFSGLNTAYTALTAARKGLDVVGQNIANATTEGYTRQRVTTSAIGSVAQVGPLSNRLQVGQGVAVDGIARIGNIFLDTHVRGTAAVAGFWAVQANTMTALETSLAEPGENGISAQLQEFWAAWGDLANRPGEPAPAGVVLEQSSVLITQLAAGYRAVEDQWGRLRSELEGMTGELNETAAGLADVNRRIRAEQAAGGSVNELLDVRDRLATTIAALSGGSVRYQTDGTVEVLVGGNALVSGDKARTLALLGSQQLTGAAASPPQLVWADRPGSPISMDGGEIAGALSLLAPANPTQTGGRLAEAAAGYNALALELATAVNAAHNAGVTPGGTPGGDFFVIDTALPAALGLSILPTDAATIATGTAGAGPLDGSNADHIAQLGMGTDSPDQLWSRFVTGIGVATRTTMQQAVLGEMAANSAAAAQLSGASVDLDEENVNMLTYQVAYQGAARVMTAVDEMLDTLINRTGIVGR